MGLAGIVLVGGSRCLVGSCWCGYEVLGRTQRSPRVPVLQSKISMALIWFWDWMLCVNVCITCVVRSLRASCPCGLHASVQPPRASAPGISAAHVIAAVHVSARVVAS